MVSADEYPCVDATEASNISCLPSDSCGIDTSVKESDTEPMNQEVKDCSCHKLYGIINRGVPAEQYYRTDAADPSSKKEQSISQKPPLQSTMPCLCRAHKMPYTLPLKYKNGNSEGNYTITTDVVFLRIMFRLFLNDLLDVSNRSPLWCPFPWKWSNKGYPRRQDKTYKVKLKQQKCPHYAEPFMCCEISEGIPNKRSIKPLKTVTASKVEEKAKIENLRPMEKIEIYYFDHGNSAYFRTTDSPPILATEKCAEKTDQAATRFWAEIFGTIHIGTAFVTAFILQLIRFVLYSIIRPLTVGIMQMFADYFIKPCLSILFNALIQPVLILFYNIATSLKDLCEPIAEAIGLFLREIASLFAAIRIVEVKQGVPPTVNCT
ncbi:LOW QUALITY PROTEIN: uncharacterized protein LOC144473770 [Augochlora pura]